MHLSNDHTAHDATLISGHAAGDLVGSQLLLANRLLVACEECARLHADLRTLAAATRALPSQVATAPRDFRLTADQAERLGRGGFLRRLLRPFAGGSSGVRSVATAFSTLGALGLAMVLLIPILGGTAALTGLERDTFSAVGGAPTAEPQAPPVPGGAGAVASPGAPAEGQSGATAAPGGQPDNVDGDKGTDEEGGRTDGTTAGPQPNAVVFALLGSGALLAIGLALFALRIVARRVA